MVGLSNPKFTVGETEPKLSSPLLPFGKLILDVPEAMKGR